MIKNFMRTAFSKLLDIFVILCFVGVFIGAMTYAIIMGGHVGVVAGIFTFLLTLCFGAVSVIVWFGIIYILLDIRDSSLEIRDSLKKQ